MFLSSSFSEWTLTRFWGGTWLQGNPSGDPEVERESSCRTRRHLYAGQWRKIWNCRRTLGWLVVKGELFCIELFYWVGSQRWWLDSGVFWLGQNLGDAYLSCKNLGSWTQYPYLYSLPILVLLLSIKLLPLAHHLKFSLKLYFSPKSIARDLQVEANVSPNVRYGAHE